MSAATVTPIRPGMECKPDIRYIHALPPGLSLLDLRDERGNECSDLRLSFDVVGDADALVAAGIATREMLASIPKCGKKVMRDESPISHMTYLRRRKSGYWMNVNLYGDNNPAVARYVAMFGLRRNAPAEVAMTQGGLAIARKWERLGSGHRKYIETVIDGFLNPSKP